MLRQVAADARVALCRAHYQIDGSPIRELRCVEDHPETELEFGRQLWFFESRGEDQYGRRVPLFGAVEYSLQFGLTEIVEDGVFEDTEQRDRFHQVFLTSTAPPLAPSGWRKLFVFMLLFIAVALACLWLARHVVLIQENLVT